MAALGLPPFVWRILMFLWIFGICSGLYALHHSRPYLAIFLGSFFFLDLQRRYTRAASFNAVEILKRTNVEYLKSMGVQGIQVVQLPKGVPTPVVPPAGGGKLH